MKARSRSAIGWATLLIRTDSGRATTVSTRPVTSACTTVVPSMRPGESSSPSITKSPIWASHATPSANDLVATRWGSSLLPRMRAAT